MQVCVLTKLKLCVNLIFFSLSFLLCRKMVLDCTLPPPATGITRQTVTYDGAFSCWTTLPPRIYDHRKLHSEVGEQDNVLHCFCLRSSNLRQVLHFLHFGLLIFPPRSYTCPFCSMSSKYLSFSTRCLSLIRMHLIQPQGWLQYCQYFRWPRCNNLKYQHHSRQS